MCGSPVSATCCRMPKKDSKWASTWIEDNWSRFHDWLSGGLEDFAFGVCMKLAIAIAMVVLWLFFPAAHAVRWCRRWRARREAANYSRMLFK
jgi:glutathione S-transferase